MRPRFVQIFCELVKIDSESGNEDKIMEHLKESFTRELGAHCTSDAYGNLIARVAARDSKRSEPVLLGAHADTVKPGKGIEPTLKEGELRTASDTILGADDKAEIVEIFEGVRTAPAARGDCYHSQRGGWSSRSEASRYNFGQRQNGVCL